MPGAQPRKNPDRQALSSVRRQAYVGRSTPGVARVTRKMDRPEVQIAAGSALVDYGYLRIDSGTANGSTLGSGLSNLKGSSQLDTLANGAAASYSSSTGIFTVTTPGLWVLSAYLAVTSPVTGSSLSVSTPRVASAEASPISFFHPDSIVGVPGANTAATCSPPTPWGTAGSTGYCPYYSPSSGAVIVSFYLVLYPIALF